MNKNHEVERVENLMYKGCEPHWHCTHCNDYWPFHCYGKKDLEQMECPARKALKEQEPVKPVPAINDVGDWLCGNCFQGVVGEEELDASGFVPVKFNFCPNCGREVKWG